jgi:phosphate transport system protein
LQKSLSVDEVGVHFALLMINSDAEIKQIRELVLEMGSRARSALAEAFNALMGDRANIDQIEMADRFLDEAERNIDSLVLRCLALRRPVSKDLRFMLVSTRIAGHWERVGDEITSIVRQARLMKKAPPHERAKDLREMSQLLSESIDETMALLREQPEGDAPTLVKKDKSIDAINRKIFTEEVQELESGAGEAALRIQIMLISRSLERIGDNVKQIAQDIHYMNHAEDIRHTSPDANSAGQPPTCQVI